MELTPEILLLFSISFLANSLSAFAGGGAGLVQLPLLLFLGLPFPTALATHKLASVALGIGASLRHFQGNQIKKFLSAFILFFGLPGVFAGSHIALLFPEKLALVFLGFLTCSLGIYSSMNSRFGVYTKEFVYTKFNLFFGGVVLFFIGFLNGSFSSGTGLFVTIWLVRWFSLSYTEAVSYTLIFVGLWWNGLGSLVLGLNGQIHWDWIPVLILGALIGGYVGAHFSLLKGNVLVKKFFEYVSLAIGASLIYRGFLQ